MWGGGGGATGSAGSFYLCDRLQQTNTLQLKDCWQSEEWGGFFPHLFGCFSFSTTDRRASQFIDTHTCFHTAPSLFSLLCSCTPNRESAQVGGTPSRSTLSHCTSISALALVTGSLARLDLFRLIYLCVGLARRYQPAGRCRTDTGLCYHDAICSGTFMLLDHWCPTFTIVV